MDYGKYSYIKLSEKDDASTSKVVSANSALEYSLPVIGRQVVDSFTLNIASIELTGKAFFQNNITVQAAESGEILVELLIDGVAVEAVTRSIASGETSILLMKTFSPSAPKTVTVEIRVKPISENFSVTVVSNILAVWGAVADTNASAPSTIRSLAYENKYLISFVRQSKIFYALVNDNTQSIESSQFQQLADGISHCFAVDRSGNLLLFRVDADGNLFMSQFGQAETLIDSGISVVYASACPLQIEEEILLCYIKAGKPKYRTITNFTIGAECSFDCPSGTYSDIYIANSLNAKRMYVVCTSKSGHNYIMISEEDGILSGFAENLSASATMTVTRYISYKNLLESNAENLDVDVSFFVQKHYLAYEEFFRSGLFENLHADAALDCSVYPREYERSIVYSIFFNQKEKFVGTKRIVYGDDAAGWVGVNPNIPSVEPLGAGTFDDPDGLNQKWPFNEIKPCLVQNGELVGYLNPNDFSKFEDGTNADIYSGDYDVMIQFPKMYWKIEEDWDGTRNITNTTRANIKITVTDKAADGFVCLAHTKAGKEYDYIYVGAYESNIENGKLYCCSGKMPTSDITHVEVLKNWSSLRGSSYTTFDYHFTTYLYILQMLYFGEHYGCSFLGNGWTSSTTKLENSGVLDQAGMFYGSSVGGYGNVSSNINILSHNKLFGLENIWGHSKTYVDGILLDDNRVHRIIDPTLQTSTHNLLATGYNSYATNITANFTETSWVTLFTAGNNIGFLPVAVSTSSSNKTYTETRCGQYRPSSYRYFTPDAECPYMMYFYGGSNIRFTGFCIQSDRDYSVTDIYHNERIICYPESKLSET